MQISDLIPWNRERKEMTREHNGGNNPLLSLQRDINRVFDTFWSRLDQPVGPSNRGLSSTAPSTDVSETNEAIEISVELPGMDEKDIDVSLSGDVLTIRGEKKVEREDKKRGYYLAERSYGSFYRSIPVPSGIDGERAEAQFKKGVLTVTVPKTPEAQEKVRKIEVKA